MFNHTPHVLAGLAAMAIAGCGSAPSDKAGGSKPAARVLTLANADTGTRDVGPFVAAVERVSHGRLKIRVRSDVHHGRRDAERLLIADARARRYDLVKVGARAWDLAGVNAFEPLVAPFVVTSVRQQQRLLATEEARKALRRVAALGLHGIALLPGDLRYPTGIARVVTRADDFAGARVGVRESGIAARAFAALGARSRPLVAGGSYDGLDVVEQDPVTLSGADGLGSAGSLTGNVPLWPRTQSIVMSDKVYAGLDAQQRSWLAQAGREAIRPTLDTIVSETRAAMEFVCNNSSFTLVQASREQVAAMRRRVEPVLDETRRDPASRDLLEAALRLQGAPDVVRCPAAHPSAAVATQPTPLDGVWQSDVTRSRYFAAHPSPGEDNEANWGPQTLRLDRGRFTLTNERFPGEVFGLGSYRVKAERIVFTAGGSPQMGGGETWTYRFSRYRNTMQLRRVGPVGPTALQAAPFIKSR